MHIGHQLGALVPAQRVAYFTALVLLLSSRKGAQYIEDPLFTHKKVMDLVWDPTPFNNWVNV